MKKKISAIVLTVMLILGTITGCSGKDAVTPPAERGGQNETPDIIQDDGGAASGKVVLKVWAEEAQHPTVQKMIDSFIEEYKGQADFEITLEAQPDSTTRSVLLGDVQNAADVFSFPDDQCIRHRCKCTARNHGTQLVIRK